MDQTCKSDGAASPKWSPRRLADEEWTRLAGIADLPAESRNELENTLGWGKLLREIDSQPTPSALKESLAELRKHAEALLPILCVPGVTHAITYPTRHDAGFGLGQRPPTLEYELLVQSLAWVITQSAGAEGRISRGDTGNKTAAADMVTGGVDTMLRKHKKRGLKRNETSSRDSGEELLEACFALLGIKVETVTAIRRLHARQKVRAARKEAAKAPQAEYEEYER